MVVTTIPYLVEILRKLECISEEDFDDYINNSNSVFTRPFIITLRKDKIRHENAYKLLKSMGLNPITFYAIEGSKIEGMRMIRDTKLKLGEKGCLMSHLCIAALASYHKDKYTLVFEDDITSSLIGESLNVNLNKLLELPKPDLVYLGKCFETCTSMQKIKDNIYKTFGSYCTHALAIRGEFAAKFIGDFDKSNKEAVDNLYRRYSVDNSALIYTYHPALFYQDVLSTNSNLRPKADQLGAYTECLDCQIHPEIPKCETFSQKEEIQYEKDSENTKDIEHIEEANKKNKCFGIGWLMMVIISIVILIVLIIIICLSSKFYRQKYMKQVDNKNYIQKNIIN